MSQDNIEFILDLSKNQKFFIWLYSPSNILSIHDVITINKNIKLPNNLILYKIVQYLLIVEEVGDISNIINKIIDLDILLDYKIDQLVDFIKDIKKEGKTLQFINSSKVANILYLTENIKIHTDSDHKGYPLPDPNKGRPYLDWLKCQYEGCNKTFPNVDDFIKHLKQEGSYTQSFHAMHEDIVWFLKLTPEKILNNNIKYCPSYICDMKQKIFTPQELCDHFKYLGIEPFWEKGMDLTKKSDNFEKIIIGSDKIFIANECVICLTNVPDIIYLPCMHNILCFYCSQNYSDNKCPLCMKKIENKIPF